jgi:hypothetical protein
MMILILSVIETLRAASPCYAIVILDVMVPYTIAAGQQKASAEIKTALLQEESQPVSFGYPPDLSAHFGWTVAN